MQLRDWVAHDIRVTKKAQFHRIGRSVVFPPHSIPSWLCARFGLLFKLAARFQKTLFKGEAVLLLVFVGLLVFCTYDPQVCQNSEGRRQEIWFEQPPSTAQQSFGWGRSSLADLGPKPSWRMD